MGTELGTRLHEIKVEFRKKPNPTELETRLYQEEVEFWKKSYQIQGDKMKNDFLEQSKIQDKLFRALNQPSPRPGIPCDHPGCASHLSHPCEGCGRYAAGNKNGPDVDHAREYIEELGDNNSTIHIIVRAGLVSHWTWEQILSAIVIEQDKINKLLTDGLAEINQRTIAFNAKIRERKNEASDGD